MTPVSRSVDNSRCTSPLSAGTGNRSSSAMALACSCRPLHEPSERRHGKQVPGRRQRRDLQQVQPGPVGIFRVEGVGQLLDRRPDRTDLLLVQGPLQLVGQDRHLRAVAPPARTTSRRRRRDRRRPRSRAGIRQPCAPGRSRLAGTRPLSRGGASRLARYWNGSSGGRSQTSRRVRVEVVTSRWAPCRPGFSYSSVSDATSTG